MGLDPHISPLTTNMLSKAAMQTTKFGIVCIQSTPFHRLVHDLFSKKWPVLDAKLHKQNHRFKHGWNLVADVLGTWLNSVWKCGVFPGRGMNVWPYCHVKVLNLATPWFHGLLGPSHLADASRLEESEPQKPCLTSLVVPKAYREHQHWKSKTPCKNKWLGIM